MKETHDKKQLKDLVKDPEWQKLRQKLIGQWKNRPDWCIQQLREYLGPINKSSDEKLYIVLNYLTGTGFRVGMISSRDNPEIAKLRGEISAELKKRKFKK